MFCGRIVLFVCLACVGFNSTEILFLLCSHNTSLARPRCTHTTRLLFALARAARTRRDSCSRSPVLHAHDAALVRARPACSLCLHTTRTRRAHSAPSQMHFLLLLMHILVVRALWAPNASISLGGYAPVQSRTPIQIVSVLCESLADFLFDRLRAQSAMNANYFSFSMTVGHKSFRYETRLLSTCARRECVFFVREMNEKFFASEKQQTHTRAQLNFTAGLTAASNSVFFYVLFTMNSWNDGFVACYQR